MEEDEKEKGLQSLINKLNHPLSEVRGRSLRNILFKLQNNLISLSELVCDKFLRHLLEWFNHQECSHESHVLELIDKLIVQHETAAQMLLEMGGVEFLSQLRLHSHESLHSLIDTILDHMLNLREMSIIQLGSVTNDQSSSNLSNDVIPVTAASIASPVNVTLSTQSFITETTTLSGISLRSIPQLQDCETQTSQPLLLDEVTQCGITGNVAHEEDTGVRQEFVNSTPPVSPQCNGLIFPWIILSHNNQHVLFTTDGRLQNSDESLVISSCEFICEVLLQDFPPEVFLQRPVITKSLMKLVSVNGSVTTVFKAVECLCELTTGLQYRLAMLHDPSMTHTDAVTSFVTYLAATSTQQHPNISDEELAAMLRDLEDTSGDKMKLIQADQLRVDQYCHQIVGHCVTMMLELLNKEELAADRASSDTTSLLCGILQLLHNAIELLSKAFFYQQKLDDTGELQSSVQATLKQSLAGIVEVLVQCMSKWQRKVHSEDQTVLCQGVGGGGGHLLFITCTVLTHIAWCFSEILRLQMDVNDCTSNLPDNSGVIIHDIVLNGFFSLCCPQIISTLLPYLKHLDKKGYNAYHQAKEMKTAFVKADIFLGLSADASLIQQLAAATECLPSLLFPLSERSVIMEKCMGLCLTNSDHQVVPLLLHLLNYPCDEVKILAYTHLEQFVTSKEAINETFSEFLTLLVEFDVLEEIVCFGLGSKVVRVANSSQCIIVHLMKMVLKPSNVDFSITSKLFRIISTFLPYLETGLCNEESNLETLKSFMSHDSLTQNQKILCALRLMLSCVSALRVWGLSVLSRQLVNDHAANKKSPFSSVSDSLLHDVLACATPPSGEHKVGTQCALNRNDVSRLTQLLASKSLDTPLRKSSLQQLYVVLQDYTLHDAAMEAGIVNHLLVILTNQLRHNKDNNTTSSATVDDLPLLPSCIGCLRLLAHTSASLRSQLAGDSAFLLDALRGVLLAQADKVLRYNTSKLLFYILYNDVAVYTHPAVGNGIAIPHQILAKLQLPYDVTPTYPVSKHAVIPVMNLALVDDRDISNMLRVYQQIAAYSSVFDLNQQTENRSTKSLLSSSELVVLTTMDQVTMAWNLVIKLEKALTHQEVAKCLDEVSIVLINLSPNNLPPDTVEKLKQILGRFLATAPINSNDCDLFCRILSFCLQNFLPATPSKVANEMDKNDFSVWLCELTTAENCTCLRLLNSTPEASSIEEADIIRLQKAVMKFYSSLLAQAPTCLFKGPFCVQLLDTLCCRLNMAGSPSYYDLPFLEISLCCLLHLTSLPLTSVSSHVMALYMRLAVSLRQVLWSFISGQGGAFASFMGKGVTLQASVSLYHLMYAMTLLEKGEKLSIEWVASSSPDVGLSWVHSLIQDRVAQVRYAGYTLMGVLCTHQVGTEALLTECQVVMPAGLWSLCTQTLLNSQECDMVRGKAGEVLLQLMKCCQDRKHWDNYISFSTQEGTVFGLQALQALLQHCNIVMFLQDTLTTLFADSAVFNSVTDDNSNIFSDHNGIRQLTVMVAPYFVSSLCRVLHNLIILLSDSLLPTIHHNGIDNLLLRLLDDQLLSYIVRSSVHLQSVVLLSSWVLMLTDVATLLCTLVRYSPQLFLTSVSKEKHVHSLFKLLTITNEYSTDQIVYRELLPLCKEVMSLLCTSGRLLGNDDSSKTFFTTTHIHWNAITVMTKRSLTDEMEELSIASLGLLNLVLSCWFKPTSDHPVDAAYREARLVSLEKKMCNSEATCASDLCTVLLSTYDSNISHHSRHNTRKCLVGQTLAILLACSDTAKTTALKAGLMESSIEVLRNLHTKLCMESLDGNKKKTSPLVSEAIQAVELMRNFMYRSELVKIAAIQCQLSAAVHKLWPWCIIDQSLMVAVLLMLGTFTAHCSKACLSLCLPTCGSTSLMQSVMKQATRTVSSYQSPLASRKQHSRHSTILNAVFSLLANTTVSPECRGLMRKFSFLDLFSTLRPKAEGGIPGRCLLFSCWLQLLVNLTRYNDGQQMVLKQPDALELIVELWQYSNDKAVRSWATLLTRNLCFYGPTKTLLASNENFLVLLQSGLRSQEVDDIAMVSSAVWALLSGCRKVRASLKKSPLPELLRHSYTTLQDSGADNCKKCLHYVLQAMNLLE